MFSAFLPGTPDNEVHILNMKIFEITEIDTEIVDALAKLLPQLSETPTPPTAEYLQSMTASDSITLFVARASGTEQITGMLVLVTFKIITGIQARIEDVVVDESARGKGVGKMLMQAAIEKAAAEGAKKIDLTSRSSREAANRLYQRLGFEIYETNVYRLHLCIAKNTAHR
jgi:ribosomal protein S18 acetylase RimI-like enzyme